MKRAFSLCLGLFWSHGWAGDTVRPVLANNGMVVCRDAEACRVGVEVLRQGGNAVDAAVAVGFALAVTVPGAGNIGGGGFLLYYHAGERRVHALDYREVAPAKANETMFVRQDGSVDAGLSRYSHLSSGVPGTVAGLSLALRRFGTMEWRDVLAPAVKLAGGGFEVPPQLARSLREAEKRLAMNPAARRIFLRPDGKPWQAGERLVQKELGATLQRIARNGPDEFYRGETARLIAAEMRRHEGLVTRQDLANYRPRMREPVRGAYRGFQVLSMPPPSSGGVHLIQMLGILEGYDLAKNGHNSAETIHLLAEAMRLAYADRSKYLGDPDFVEVPVDRLTSRAYAEALRRTIRPGEAGLSRRVAPGAHLPPESPETTHFCVVDREGNAVANTYTLNLSFGSGIVVDGAGFLLNNQMDDFSAKPGTPNAFGLLGGTANAIAPGKRMLSSMSPTIVLKDDRPVLVTGGVGGSRIITATLQVLLNVIDHGLNVQQAVNAPRVHHQWLPDRLELERGIDPQTIRRLESMGHRVTAGAVARSVTAAIAIDPDPGPKASRYHGAADPRRRACAMGF